MAKERELLAEAARIVGEAVDGGQARGSAWEADAIHWLHAVSVTRRAEEMNEFSREFGAGWDTFRHDVTPAPAALLGNADIVTCVYRTLGAVAAVAAVSTAPNLDDEMERFYGIAAALIQAVDEAGVPTRSEAPEADPIPHLTRRIKELELALDGILRQFREKGHPGYEALRASWVPVSIVKEWHAVLSGAASDTTAVLDKVPAEAVADAAQL